MRIEVPEFCLVALVGATSSGKSTFAARHFKPTEVLSSDTFRALIADDEGDQSVSGDAFEALYTVADKRLAHGRLTVIDATNLQSDARRQVLRQAKARDCHAAAIVFQLPEPVCQARNAARPDRNLPQSVVRRHCAELRRCVKNLKKEGFRFVYVLQSEEDIETAEVVRTRLWNDRRDEHGPFDIIGDIHGCLDELTALLETLGYRPEGDGFRHPQGRKAVFLGDLCDRGPKNAGVLRLVMSMCGTGDALCVPGNHDVKLVRWLDGRNVQISHGLERTVEELSAEPPEFRTQVRDFLDRLVSHFVLDRGRLVVAHGGIKEAYQGRGSARVRDFCLFGETTGETDKYGLPVRTDWAAQYRGKAAVVYGHTPQVEPQLLNNTYCIDTGCVFGGTLTALRWPERELVSVPAKLCYYEPARPLKPAREAGNDLLDAGDVLGTLRLETRLMPPVTVREEHTAAAFEVMSRFAADPRWLIYLPPTMSPCETSTREGWLERPEEAFAYYRTHGVEQVVCEQKHMGSRAVVVLCRDGEAAKRRFQISDGRRGILYTRTGRPFFEHRDTERFLLDRLDKALTESGFWADFQTDWVCLDAELMPWSVKAQSLLETQYAPVGRAGRESLSAALAALTPAVRRTSVPLEVGQSVSGQNLDLSTLLADFEARRTAMDGYVDAYRQYCWEVATPEDLRLAPFHILAAEGRVFHDRDHLWHMETIKRYIAHGDPLFPATPYRVVEVCEEASVQAGIDWWLSLTGSGGEGMVVKPFSFIARNQGKLLQPAVKCRGREYLRIIYGPEYTLERNLIRLRKRGLGRKRSLALREFALGMESLERFVRKAPLYEVHQSVFGVLALESEPVDPRL